MKPAWRAVAHHISGCPTSQMRCGAVRSLKGNPARVPKAHEHRSTAVHRSKPMDQNPRSMALNMRSAAKTPRPQAMIAKLAVTG